MQIIKITHPYEPSQIVQEPIVLALGFFDGIHLGHQEVILQAKEKAQELGVKLALMSFDHHPSIIFQGADPDELQYLSPFERKVELLEEFGVDIFYVIDFTKEFASLSPQEFVDQYMVGLNAVTVVAGFDYTYGKKEIANMELLPTYAKERFSIITISEQQTEKQKIGSTAIRHYLETGQIEEANALLGYEYTMIGKVVHGFGRGSALLGFPTANIDVSTDTYLLKKGVYIVEIQVEDKWYPAMASIGVNPTFNDVTKITIEVYILDFQRDIYELPVRVKWLHYLRDELKFDGVEALIAQLKEDEVNTKKYFEK